VSSLTRAGRAATLQEDGKRQIHSQFGRRVRFDAAGVLGPSGLAATRRDPSRELPLTRRRFACLVGPALCFGTLGACASAPPRDDGMRVVYAREDRVYVSVLDSLRPAEGDSLSFADGARKVAIGVVTNASGPDVAAVRLTSGSLRRFKRPEQLRVLAGNSRPAAPRILRVGLPGPNRANPFFACTGLTIREPGPAGTFIQERSTERLSRLIRDPRASVRTPPWPDTLLARLFDEPTDEEIALERGELDVAVFWPGELSPHIREQPRWRGFPYGTRARGLLAAIDPDSAGGAGPPRIPGRERLRGLNAGMFRGDLAPCGDLLDSLSEADSEARGVKSDGAWFEVDRACPGWEIMERDLNRGAAAIPPASASRRVRLTYLDAPSRSSSRLRDSLRVLPLFALRCPVVCAPELRAYIRGIGADALADMPECGPASDE